MYVCSSTTARGYSSAGFICYAHMVQTSTTNAAVSSARRVVNLLLAATDPNPGHISLGDDLYSTELLSERQVRLRLYTLIGAYFHCYYG